ncbi:hypothetical protein IKW73_00890 [Candidatus Saccharibacteria bacterium]|nr:hypothetical protein [Candidatus Saccharibacteria bacterium]
MSLSAFFEDAVSLDQYDSAVAILSSFKVGGYISFHTYYDALIYCDEEYLPSMRAAIARAIFLPTECGAYPFLKELEDPKIISDAKLQRLKEFFKFVDDGFNTSSRSYVISYVEYLEESDIYMLERILYFAGPCLTGCILKHCLRDCLDKEVLKYLIRFAVANEESVGALEDSELNLQEISELAPELSDEEVFGLLFCPEDVSYIGYRVPKGKKNIEKLNMKERMILLRYYFELGSDVLDNDGMVMWVRDEATKRRSPFERLMAIKTLAGCYVFTTLPYVFQSFAGRSLSPNGENAKMLRKYNIYPKPGDEITNCFLADVFSYDYPIWDYLPVILVSLYSGNDYQKSVTKALLDKIADPDISASEAFSSTIQNVKKHEPVSQFFINALVDSGKDGDDLPDIPLEIGREYFVKCIGGTAVAVVKIVGGGNPEYSIVGSGFKDAFFYNPRYVKDMSCYKIRIKDKLMFEVVRFEGNVFGTNSFSIFGNNGELVGLEVGTRINVDRTAYQENKDYTLNFYFTLKDARRALFK